MLLENRDELPWDAAALRSVAVIGNNASAARTQGGGSATVMPEYTVSPLEGLRAALPGVDVSYSVGAVVQDGVVGAAAARADQPGHRRAGLQRPVPRRGRRRSCSPRTGARATSSTSAATPPSRRRRTSS